MTKIYIRSPHLMPDVDIDELLCTNIEGMHEILLENKALVKNSNAQKGIIVDDEEWDDYIDANMFMNEGDFYIVTWVETYWVGTDKLKVVDHFHYRTHVIDGEIILDPIY